MIATKAGVNVKKNWETQKAALKARFPKLADEDLNFEESDRQEMLTNLESKLAVPVKELETILDA